MLVGYGENHDEEMKEQKTNYRLAFWMVLTALVLVCLKILTTGTAVFPKIQKLQTEMKELQKEVLKVQPTQPHKHRFFTQEVYEN